MHGTETATENYSATLDRGEVVTCNVPFSVTSVKAKPGYRFDVRFIDGTAGEVVMTKRMLHSNAGVFAPLRDPAAFAKAFVDDGVVTWPGELDLAPDAMYDEIRAHGVWELR